TAGGMKGFCQANAILTLKEYLLDTASNGRGEALEKALDLAMDEIKDPAMRQEVLKKVKEIEEGKRDLYF
ncbi:MAG: [FeFe] hydrogenase H-cluster radical SAM maturase HydG, partial [Thermodesulfobacteriota bacterium]